jgi:hypothetical protein
LLPIIFADNKAMTKKAVVSLMKSAFCIFVLQVLCACSNVPAQAALTPYPHRLAVTPHPQQVFNIEGAKGKFQINAGTAIRVLHDEDLPGAQLIADDIMRRAGIALKVQKDARKPSSLTNVIYVSRNSDDVKLGFPNALLSQQEVKRAEGYSLVISNNRVLVRASDARGAIYGIQTIRQLIRPDLSLQSLVIRDWPEMPKRMAYGVYNGGFQSKMDVERYVHRALLLKYNAIVFESSWNAKNWWFHYVGENRELAQHFQEQCRKYHIEFIPLIQGPGWGYGITDQAPMLATGVWIPKEKQTLRYAEATPLTKNNVVTNESAPIVVTNLEGKVTYQKDKDFKIIPGYTARPYSAENGAWKLQAIEGGAIADGQEVLVSYNAVTTPTAHQAWNISDPQAFEILDKTLDTVQQSLNPSTIHIGHDEIWQLGTDSRDIESGLTNEQLVQRELMHWYNRIKKNNPQATILMWDDLLRPDKSGVSNGILTGNIKEIPKDIVVVPWYYYAKPESADIIKNRLKHLTDSGFSVIGAPSGYFRENSYLWYEALQPYLKDGRAQGMMFTTWDSLHRGDLVAAGELMWSGQKVDRNLYRALDALTERVKQQGLVFTLALNQQVGAFASVVSSGLKAKKTPDQISAEFAANVIGDTTAYQKAVGAETWSELKNGAVFPEQELANLQRVPQFVQAMTDYLKADAAKDKTLLRKVIHSLHALDYFSFERQAELLAKSDTEWISFKELFGVDQPTAG